jgi:TrmH family RNA methyltransferase
MTHEGSRAIRARPGVPRVEVVLVRPETPANVGAVARVLANTGIDSLVLVAPGDYRTVECWRTAWGGYDILERARVVTSLSEAIGRSASVLAFSGKPLPGQPVLDVREAVEEIGRLGPHERASLVFGPETSGLDLSELALCGRIARIPSDPAQPSLNLSHAVMVAAYELYRSTLRGERSPRGRLASHGQKAALLKILVDGLESIRALSREGPERYLREWEGMIQRLELTPREVRLLEHAARKMSRAGRGR